VTPSQNCIILVKQFEGLRLTAYQNPGDVPTIGWGHTKGVRLGDAATPAQCEAWLQEDLDESADFVNEIVTVPLTQNQFDALCDFDFEEGAGHLGTSTLLHLLNQGAYSAAANQFSLWVYGRDASGKLIAQPGQVKRRAAERELFLRV
jgi:lysozyme